MHIPKPFKNPAYVKNNTRRTQTMKTLLSREKERDKAVRAEMSRLRTGIDTTEEMTDTKVEDGQKQAYDGEDRMDLDPAVKRPVIPEFLLDEVDIAEGITDLDDIPSCECSSRRTFPLTFLRRLLH